MAKTDRAEKLALAHDRLAESVATMSTSSGWVDYLAHAARFHNYSPNNIWLIMCQRPDATRVAGFLAWKEHGRSVVKGAKGIAILAPCIYKDKDTEESHVAGFRITYVFDVSDTEGDPLPESPAKVALLTGDSPDGMWDYLVAEVEARGFHVELGTDSEHGENGYTQHATKTVRIVTGGRSPAAMVKTLAHELAHVILHASTADYLADRGLCEVEAESVAFLVCDAFGLASDDYTFGYVTTWANADAKVVLATAKRVQLAAAEILANLEAREMVPA